jgi:hypothetical protein
LVAGFAADISLICRHLRDRNVALAGGTDSAAGSVLTAFHLRDPIRGFSIFVLLAAP